MGSLPVYSALSGPLETSILAKVTRVVQRYGEEQA